MSAVPGWLKEELTVYERLSSQKLTRRKRAILKQLGPQWITDYKRQRRIALANMGHGDELGRLFSTMSIYVTRGKPLKNQALAYQKAGISC